MDDVNELHVSYEQRHTQVLVPLAVKLEAHLHRVFKGTHRLDRISARAKSPERFRAKASKLESGRAKYDHPLNQIQDQLGERIVVFYRRDVETACAVVERYFRPIEYLTVVPDSESEFGYFGKHYVLLLPSDLQVEGVERDRLPSFFELQVKTLFQHAWAEANHDLAYKPNTHLTPDQQRLVAFTSAQAWRSEEHTSEL